MPPSCSTFGLAQTSKPGVTNMGGEVAEPKGGIQQYVKQHANFGLPPGSGMPNPNKILKKRENSGARVETLSEIKRTNPEVLQPSKLKSKSKPPVPDKSNKPIMNLVTSKNFVTANAVENILTAPKKVSKETRDYLNKADYGKTPAYLTRIKADIDEEYAFIRQMQEEEEAEKASQMRPLSDNDKEVLIEGLKAKWEKVNTDYQATTHITKLDTIGKVRRKELYESSLSQIEKDIEKLNKKYIFVDSAAGQ